MKALILGLALITTIQLSARTFTSADGKRTMEAKLFSYSPSTDTIVLQINGQKSRTTVKASLFSEADQEYFKEFLRESEKFSALRITSKEESEGFEDDKGIYIYDKRKQHFDVVIVNNANFPLEELTAKYDIYLYKYDKEGKKVLETVSGQESIESIAQNDVAELTTDSVEITTGCETTSSCPKCVKHADAVNRERVIGVRVQVFNGEDELLSEYHSSNTTETIANKEDADS
ncbi:MAG: hypothetical protein AB8D78_06810 [Akkermansiaceae bacterium]